MTSKLTQSELDIMLSRPAMAQAQRRGGSDASGLEKPATGAPLNDVPPPVSKDDLRREAEIQREIVEYLMVRPNGVKVVGFGRTDKLSHYTVSWPDLTISWHGRSVAFEAKPPGKGATPEQYAFHELMREDGWLVFVVHSIEETKAVLDQLS